jgi:hypothetical protein
VNVASDSCYRDTVSQLPFGGTYRATVRAGKTAGHLDGVSTLDLVLISRHILNLQPLPSYYQLLAADANSSGTVSTLDVVELRKLILGIYDTLPNAPAWRVIRPVANPLQLALGVAPQDTYQVVLNNLTVDQAISNLHFVGIKTGDVNTSASLQAPDDRAALALTFDDVFLAAGETARLPLRLGESAVLSAWQLALSAGPDLEIAGVEGLADDDYALSPGGDRLRALRFEAGAQPLAQRAGDALLTLVVRARRPVRFAEALALEPEALRAEAYSTDGGARTLTLVPGRSEAGAVLLAPRPNPLTAETRFGVAIERETAVQLEVFELGGRRVYFEEVELAPGRHELVLPRAALPGSGLYAYRVRAGAAEVGGRLLVAEGR